MSRPATRTKKNPAPAPSPPRPAGPLARRLENPWLIAALLAAATLVVFWPVTGFAFINYDDDIYIASNLHVQSGLNWASLRWAFTTTDNASWYPLTWLSFMLDAQLFGLNPGWHHLTNLLFHAANSVLLFLVLRRLTGAVWPGALVAALFAFHPLRVETVAWVAERKGVLSAFFGFLSLLCYARYAQLQIVNRKSKIVNYSLALFFFICGLLSKPMLVTLPFVLLLLDYWPLQRIPGLTPLASPAPSRNPPRRPSVWLLVGEKIPFLLAAIAFSSVTFLVHKQTGAVATLATLPFALRVENTFVSYVRYLGKTLWPVNLALPYPYPGRWPLALVASGVVVVLGLSVTALWWARRRPYWFTGWFWFLGTLIPVIGLVQWGIQSMADRFTYFPVIGLLILLVWSGAELSRRWRVPAPVLLGVALVLLGACIARTRDQLRHWKNDETLFSHTLNVTADNFLAHYNLGCFLNQNERTAEAFEHFQATARINPAHAKALNNMGRILAGRGDPAAAMALYQRALQLKPDYIEAQNNLGAAFADRKQYAEAMAYYERILQQDPDQVGAHYNLGCVLAAVGRVEDAIRHYRRALELQPDLAVAHNNLGIALARQGQLDAALEHYAEALRLQPGHAETHNNLAHLLMTQGALADAARHYQESLRLNPAQLQAQFNLGNTLALQKNYAAAITHYTAARQLAPDHAPTRKNLGMALARLGRRAEAVAQLNEALRLNPDYEEARRELRALENPAP